jgi:hypothetical protein
MVPVMVEAVNGRFQASLVGAPAFRADGATKDEAIGALQAVLAGRTARGEVVWIDSPKVGLIDLAGVHADDPDLDEIVREAYRLRDEQKAREFPE